MSLNSMALSDDEIPSPSSRADSGTHIQDITYVLSDRFWVQGPTTEGGQLLYTQSISSVVAVIHLKSRIDRAGGRLAKVESRRPDALATVRPCSLTDCGRRISRLTNVIFWDKALSLPDLFYEVSPYRKAPQRCIFGPPSSKISL